MGSEAGGVAGLGGMAAAVWRYGNLGFWKGILLRKGFGCRKMEGLAANLNSEVFSASARQGTQAIFGLEKLFRKNSRRLAFSAG